MQTRQIHEERGASVATEHNSDDAAFGTEIQKMFLSGHGAGSACWQSRTMCMPCFLLLKKLLLAAVGNMVLC